MQGNTYTDPKLYGETLEDEWFVGFTFTCPIRKKKKRPQVRLGINYQPTVRGRLKEGDNVLNLVKKCLLEGWNPFDSDIKAFVKQRQAPVKTVNSIADMPLNEGLDWAFSKKSLKQSGILKNALGHIKNGALRIGFDCLPIKDITRFHVCEILDSSMILRQEFYDKSTNRRYKGKKVTNNLYNILLDRFSALMFEFENRGIIEHNPCRKIVKKDPIDFGIHRHATAEEVAIIKEQLPQRHYELYMFTRFEYITGMRPDEILDVKFHMADYINNTINISDAVYNDSGELISKTTAYRMVPVPKFLMDWIKEREAGRDPDRYLFSYKLRPGYHRLSRCWISMLWKEHVIDGIGINVSIYSFKGKGGEAKREAGVELKAVAAGYGHTTTKMASKIYLTGEGERLNNQIKEKTPDL